MCAAKRGLVWLTLAAVSAGGAGRAAESEAGAGAAVMASPSGGGEARLYLSGSRRFEVVADAGEEGRRLARLAEEAWPAWSASLGLPDRLRAPIMVRLAAPERWGFAEPAWRVVAEPGGVVTIWIRGGGAADAEQERRWLTALAEGTLRRQAILLGADLSAVAPHWLAAGAAEDAMVKARPSMLDAWRQAATGEKAPLSLREILYWEEGQAAAPDDARRMGAYGLWLWLQAESGRTGAWRNMVDAMLTGTVPGLALVRAYPTRFERAGAGELELAWAVGLAGVARMRALPLMEAGESRRWLEQADRLVALSVADDVERVVMLADAWDARRDAFLAAEREIRVARLSAHLTRVHPFYRNAAGSLGRVFLALEKGDERAWAAARDEWREDMATGREIEQASAALLDAASR